MIAKKLVVSISPQYGLIGAAAVVFFACEGPEVTDGGKFWPGTGGKKL